MGSRKLHTSCWERKKRELARTMGRDNRELKEPRTPNVEREKRVF